MKKRNMTIEYLRAFAIILVVLGHCLSYYSNTVAMTRPVKMIFELIYSVHVPLFFFISGYLCHRQEKKEFIKKKIIYILIPFFVFSVLKILYSGLLSNEFAHAEGVFSQIYDAFICGNLYWFSYSLFLMFIIMVFFWNFDEKVEKVLISIFTIVIIGFNILMLYLKIDIDSLSILQFGKTIRYIPFFTLGYLFKVNYNKYEKFSNVFIYIMAMVLIIVVSIYYYNGADTNNYIAFIIVSFPLMLYLRLVTKMFKNDNKILALIGKYSYQLMFFDSFNKVILFTVFEKIINPIPLYMIVLITILNVLLGLIYCSIIKRIKFLRILIGIKD